MHWGADRAIRSMSIATYQASSGICRSSRDGERPSPGEHQIGRCAQKHDHEKEIFVIGYPLHVQTRLLPTYQSAHLLQFPPRAMHQLPHRHYPTVSGG